MWINNLHNLPSVHLLVEFTHNNVKKGGHSFYRCIAPLYELSFAKAIHLIIMYFFPFWMKARFSEGTVF